MKPEKQNLVKSQKTVIAITTAMDLVLWIGWFFTKNTGLKLYLAIFAAALMLFLLALVIGLKKVKQTQSKIDKGQLDDADVQKVLSTPVIDERQIWFLLKSYQLGFWFMIFVLWSGTFMPKELSGDFIRSLAIWGGLGVNVTYANLKGASPFVDGRFGFMEKYGRLLGWLTVLYGLFLMASVLVGYLIKFDSAIFADKGTGTLVILGIVLIAMGGSILYRRYLDHKEEE